MKMTNERVMELLRIAVDHIENFEEDEAENVLASLGFTEDELAEIRFNPRVEKEEEGHSEMIASYLLHGGKIVPVLNKLGADYIFSDQREDDNSVQGFVTDCVPFKDCPHYVYPWEDNSGVIRYTAYAWYSRHENYIEDFASLEEALDWLVKEE